MSKAAVLQSIFIPAPIGGINKQDNMVQMPLTDARTLANYFCYPWGIIERAAVQTVVSNIQATDFIPVQGDSGDDRLLIVATNNTVVRLDTTDDTTPTDVTNTATITNTAAVYWTHFNNRVFFVNEVDVPWLYSRAAGNCSQASFTGPTGGGTAIAHCWNYKSRLYLLDGLSGTETRVWYGAVDAISGTFSQVDFAGVLKDGGYLLCGTSWSFNQGLGIEELFVLFSTTGEVLIYSGDNPGAANWQIISRTKIPRPVGRGCLSFVGDEVFVNTEAGLYSLRELFTTGQQNRSKISFTKKLFYDDRAAFSNKGIAPSFDTPFLFGNALSETSLYAMNYETGAWSQLNYAVAIGAIGTYRDHVFFGNSAGNGIYRQPINTIGNYPDAGETSGAASTVTAWSTPWFDYGSSNVKRIVKIDVIGREPVEFTFRHGAYCTVDFGFTDGVGGSSSSAVSTGSLTGTVATQGYILELRPVGVGRYISINLTKTPDGEVCSIAGIKVWYEEGGIQ